MMTAAMFASKFCEYVRVKPAMPSDVMTQYDYTKWAWLASMAAKTACACYFVIFGKSQCYSKAHKDHSTNFVEKPWCFRAFEPTSGLTMLSER